MRRFGVHPDLVLNLAKELAEHPAIELAGVYSHFAESDDESTERMDAQLLTFTHTREELAKSGITPPIAHISNSAALLRNRSADFDHGSSRHLSVWHSAVTTCRTLPRHETCARMAGNGAAYCGDVARRPYGIRRNVRCHRTRTNRAPSDRVRRRLSETPFERGLDGIRRAPSSDPRPHLDGSMHRWNSPWNRPGCRRRGDGDRSSRFRSSLCKRARRIDWDHRLRNRGAPFPESAGRLHLNSDCIVKSSFSHQIGLLPLYCAERSGEELIGMQSCRSRVLKIRAPESEEPAAKRYRRL